MEMVVIEILTAVGVYSEIREKVNSDSELFASLVAIAKNETASRVSSPGRP